MSFRVLLFGPYAATLGRSDVVVRITNYDRGPCTAGQILTSLSVEYPAISPLLSHAKLAVNGRYAKAEQPIDLQDELAVIGMVSGG